MWGKEHKNTKTNKQINKEQVEKMNGLFERCFQT